MKTDMNEKTVNQIIAGKVRASELTEAELDQVLELTGHLPYTGGTLSFVQKCNIVL